MFPNMAQAYHRMKKIESSKKAHSAVGYCKHLRPYGKRLANKATRRLARQPAWLVK